ncbi:MAG: calcium-translocating P-type ATPase, PMCA-type [Prevotella sp.]|nr:calcium-translocating P-type ATPase, PMCA-type [Prevotella sp.]
MAKTQRYLGLTDEEVAESRCLHGENVLTPPEREPLWRRFLEKFRDPLIVILLVAGVLSIGISFYEYLGLHEDATVFFEPVGIFIAIILATGLAFAFEYKADQEFAVLNQVNDDEPVQVVRNGLVTKVPKREVVVGDIVVVGTGDEIAADGTLLEATLLNVDESTLTGEPVAEKRPQQSDDISPEHTASETSEGTAYPAWMVLRGTKVMEGHGVFRAEKVGDATENGKVFTAAQIDDSVKTPLNEQLDRLGRLISRASYGIALLIIIGRIAGYLITVGSPFSLIPFLAYFLQTVMIAVTLIVVAVPEGLPMAVTLSLAYSMRRMLKTNNLVRKMHACETMGATTVICTDKTGTLTQNKMQVYDFMGDTTGNLQPPQAQMLFEGIAANSTAQLNGNEVVGNPTEGALLLWLKNQGADYQSLREAVEIMDELPFSTERKYMSTTVRSACMNGDVVTYIKGAPEIVMPMCDLTDEQKDAYLVRLHDYQSKAMRTLAFACDRKFLGIVAISDPVRTEVPAAVRECLDAGIDVKIVTGDTPGTALEIARQIGLIRPSFSDSRSSSLATQLSAHSSPMIITGQDFEALSDEELRQRVGELKIIARARPMDKKRLVEALQARGEVVAVTGDGTNDAPALRAAHVGLSMGDGTAVAKEASDITIIDNSFSSIGRAVMWGRSLYRNIQRFILFQMTVNVVACLIVLVGAFFDTQSPLTVTQMLWVNLIMDTFAAMALASLPPTESVMKEKPRNRRSFIISRPMKWFILGVGLAMTFVLLAIYFWFERTGSFTPYELSQFFTIFVMLQFWNLFNAKAFMTGKSAFWHLRECKGFLFIATLIFFGQILIVEFGGVMFSVVPLSLADWLLIIVNTSFVFLAGELYRIFRGVSRGRK